MARERMPAVYILANGRNGTLYTGVTSDLPRRIWEHRNGVVDGFSRKYAAHRLVYFELHDTMVDAIAREKQIKAGSRRKKLELIEAANPAWRDLYDEIR
jgi:putative endonuclease